MFLLGFRRKLTALALCKSIDSAIQWFQIHRRITFATMQNPAVYLSGARVSIFSTLVPRLTVDTAATLDNDGVMFPLCRSCFAGDTIRTGYETFPFEMARSSVT